MSDKPYTKSTNFIVNINYLYIILFDTLTLHILFVIVCHLAKGSKVHFLYFGENEKNMLALHTEISFFLDWVLFFAASVPVSLKNKNSFLFPY